ncbi:cell division protein FtsI/penicillin-binding protein 2 [Nonomuraea thailandensis]|uniref:Cell division protein FtsI/penicillin-binding protein 2 n=1 Tax=Nonomuraea thailandensis TaxID=1188745 RepID=A0A9X2K5P3_9ACTN|nr:penicillin-binding transpeptidase domain-containing protein [Nonomuraea thailandensis]MCP2361732.1 cell division protein FtsI/penicillin-binding protein 2 [Nonomuraea thailandensis]
MRRARRTLAATVTLAVASTTLTGCFEEPSPHDAVRDFLVGWQTEDYELAAGRTDGDVATVRKALADAKLELDAASFRFKIKSISMTGDESKADFHAEVDLGENNPLWGYEGVLPLHLVDGSWKVRWSPSVLHPELKEGQRFAVDTQPRPRQPIVDRAGDPLQSDTLLYVAGVYPNQLGGRAEEVVTKLAEVTGYAQDRLLSRVRSSPPEKFVQLVTFGRSRYQSLQSKLEAIDGIKVEPQKQPVDPDAPRQLVGNVSALTPETEQKLGGPQRAGDSVGRNGLQQAYQNYLTGSTETKVITLDLKTGRQVAELEGWPGRQNVSVKTTIDRATQAAAEQAVADTGTSALVAVQRDTGEILAVSTKGLHQERDALAGKFPAGTAFSIVAADALLKKGVSTKQKLACPQERTVGGAKFVHAGQAAGVTTSATFQENFAKGCVTALASLARRVTADDLQRSAKAFGVGQPWRLPLKSFSGTLPELSSDADKAKAIAGQNVEMSPLSMALVAAAVGSGTWRPPVLVTDPKSPDPSAEAKPVVQPAPVPMDAKVRTALMTMMRAGAAGTPAQAGKGRVYGVRASAADQQGWFVGWQGDVAIAVLTKNYDAAAVAGSFFAGLRNPS